MAGCVLTSGYQLACQAGSAGVHTVYIAGHFKGVVYYSEADNGGASTGILESWEDPLAVSTLDFKTFEQDVQIAAGTENVVADRVNQTVYIEQSVEITIHYGKDPLVNDANRTMMQELIKGNMAIIVRENNGNHRLYGAENGLRVTAGAGGTGKAFGDLNGIVLTLSGMEPDFAPLVNLGITAPVNGQPFTI